MPCSMLKWVWLPSQATLMIVWLINVYLSSVYIFNYAYMIYIYRHIHNCWNIQEQDNSWLNVQYLDFGVNYSRMDFNDCMAPCYWLLLLELLWFLQLRHILSWSKPKLLFQLSSNSYISAIVPIWSKICHDPIIIKNQLLFRCTNWQCSKLMLVDA